MASASPPPSAKPDFWRIRNINISEKGAAEAWLREQVEELEISEGEGFSLAADSERTLCATFASFKRPTPSNRRWIVDKDFIGFTPLCAREDASLDVVAVTGLGGHALGSFRSTDGTSVWLRDFGPEDVSQARFITYGYGTTVASSDSNQGVREVAMTLLQELAIFRRRTRSEKRPLCFVCHSLGGVVLKEALVISSRATEPEHAGLHGVMIATQGLVLLGVPNLGLRHNQLRTMVNGRPNEGFITDLLVRTDGGPSQFLSYLTDEFARLCKRQKGSWRIVSYYETMSSTTVAVSVPPDSTMDLTHP